MGNEEWGMRKRSRMVTPNPYVLNLLFQNPRTWVVDEMNDLSEDFVVF